MTDEQVEQEIERLLKSPAVQLRRHEKRGEQLKDLGATSDTLESMLAQMEEEEE